MKQAHALLLLIIFVLITPIFAMNTKNSSTLKMLLAKSSLHKEDLLEIKKELENDTDLTKELNFRSKYISDDAALVVAKILKNNETLTDLDLSNNNITGKGFAAIFKALNDNNALKRLNLRNNQWGPVSCGWDKKCMEKLAVLLKNESMVRYVIPESLCFVDFEGQVYWKENKADIAIEDTALKILIPRESQNPSDYQIIMNMPHSGKGRK